MALVQHARARDYSGSSAKIRSVAAEVAAGGDCEAARSAGVEEGRARLAHWSVWIIEVGFRPEGDVRGLEKRTFGG